MVEIIKSELLYLAGTRRTGRTTMLYAMAKAYADLNNCTVYFVVLTDFEKKELERKYQDYNVIVATPRILSYLEYAPLFVDNIDLIDMSLAIYEIIACTCLPVNCQRVADRYDNGMNYKQYIAEFK